MKNIGIILLTLLTLVSCEDDFLDEKPEDFLSSANAYSTYDDFIASVNNLYFLSRRQFYSRDENRPFDFLYGTDIVYDGENNKIKLPGYRIDAIVDAAIRYINDHQTKPFFLLLYNGAYNFSM